MLYHRMDLGRMQLYVNWIFKKVGRKNTDVLVVNVDSNLVAYTIGYNYELILGKPFGRIFMNLKYLARHKFTDPEIKFILAHEFTHILKNHLIATGIAFRLEKLLKGQRNENYQIVESIKSWLKLGSLLIPPQEYEADHGAVSITRDLSTAIGCLCRLVGYDLNRPSHDWELFGTSVPAMTMGARIDELKKRSSQPFFWGSRTFNQNK